MAGMPRQRKEETLTEYFISKSTEFHNGEKQRINRPNAQWLFKDMLKDYEYGYITDLIDYYFGSYNSPLHDLNTFKYNYDAIEARMERYRHEKEEFDRLKEESKRRAEAWEQRFKGRE